MRNCRHVQRQSGRRFLSLAFGRFWHGFLGRLKPNLRMRPIAERLFRRRTAATKRHSCFHWKRVSIRVFQFNRSLHDVRAVLNRLDRYFSHDASNLNEKYVRRLLYRNCAVTKHRGGRLEKSIRWGAVHRLGIKDHHRILGHEWRT